MEIIVSSVIGGQIVAEVGMERVLHQLIIEMRKSLKKQFANNAFNGVLQLVAFIGAAAAAKGLNKLISALLNINISSGDG